MKKLFSSAAILLLATGITQADTNAVPGTGAVTAQETVAVAGTFDHSGLFGDPDNTTGSIAAGTFANTFNVNQVIISGSAQEVIAGTWLSEVDFAITDPNGNAFLVNNDSATQVYAGPIDITATGNLAGTSLSTAGPWVIEAIEGFDDGAGADSQTSNLMVEFLEIDVDSDSNGAFTLGALGATGSTDASIGEFAQGGVLDTYDFTLTDTGIFTAETGTDGGTGFTGFDADTELFLFDGAGNLIASNDDGGAESGAFFSGIGFDDLDGDGVADPLVLGPGAYSLVVGSFNTTIDADGVTLIPGLGTGDYALTASFVAAVPEPSSVALIALAGMGLCFRRRR